MRQLIAVGCHRPGQPTTSSTADRTLSFVYGPEHQRIKQNTALTSNGTTSYFAGNVWYLNGENGQALTYEKEIRTHDTTAGTTEHKHYVRVGSLTFALVVTRSGTLNGLPASSTSYFHNDHLGSIAAITDDVGAMVERLAFDPWGKRRFVNTQPGKADALDAIVGVRTDRGYTGHEHLDEMGVIHGVGIDAVVLGMRADELRTHRAEAIGHGGHQTVVVALDVEHHTAALQHAGCRELSGPIKACRVGPVSMGVLRRLRSTRRHRRLALHP